MAFPSLIFTVFSKGAPSLFYSKESWLTPFEVESPERVWLRHNLIGESNYSVGIPIGLGLAICVELRRGIILSGGNLAGRWGVM